MAFTVMVQAQVKPEHLEAFKAGILVDARESVAKEPGCLGFNVAQDNEDPHKIHLFEIYKDEAAFESHKAMPYFEKFITDSQPWLASELIIATGTALYPES